MPEADLSWPGPSPYPLYPLPYRALTHWLWLGAGALLAFNRAEIAASTKATSPIRGRAPLILTDGATAFGVRFEKAGRAVLATP